MIVKSNTPRYPLRFHIEIDAESDYSATFTYIEESTGLPYNLTGYRAELQVRQGTNGANDVDVLLWYNTDSSRGISFNAAQGEVVVSVPYLSTKSKPWESGIYDLILISPTGSRMKLAKGFFLINPTVTKMDQSWLMNLADPENPTPSPNNQGAKGLDSNV